MRFLIISGQDVHWLPLSGLPFGSVGEKKGNCQYEKNKEIDEDCDCVSCLCFRHGCLFVAAQYGNQSNREISHGSGLVYHCSTSVAGAPKERANARPPRE